MSLTFLLQSSNGSPAFALARREELLFDTTDHPEFDGSRDYRAMVEAGLSTLNATLPEISRIAVDIGPGGLGVTRSGVAFANGLGFALGLGVISVPAFEMLASGAAEDDSPVVLMRRAARPFVHFGLWQRGRLVQYEHCEQGTAIDRAQKLDNFHYVGNVQDEALPAPRFNKAPMATMAKWVACQADPTPDTRAYPIVEALQ